MPLFGYQKLSLGSVLVGLYLFSVPSFSYSEALGLNKIPQYIGIFITAYAFYRFLKSGSIIRNKSLIFYLAFVLWSIISFVFGNYISEREELYTLIKVVIITISAASLIKDEDDFIISLSIFFFSIFFTVWLNMEEIIMLRSLSEMTDYDRFAGTFANANTAALYSLAILWAGFTLLLKGNSKTIINLLIFVGIFLAVSIDLYSGSRKGLLGLGLFSVGMGWVFVKRYGYTALRRIFFGIVIIGILGVVFLIIYQSPYFDRLSSMLSGEASAVSRIYLFEEAINLWSSSLKNAFVGVGIGNFRYYSSFFMYSHSTVSEVLVCTGIIGFILYFTSFFSLFSLFLNAYKRLNVFLSIKIINVIVFLFLVFFFSLFCVMHDDRLFWPLLGIISSYGISLLKINPADEGGNYDNPIP